MQSLQPICSPSMQHSWRRQQHSLPPSAAFAHGMEKGRGKKRLMNRASVSKLYAEYGRGAEIWPPTNEGTVSLEDSFPGGRIPPSITDPVVLQRSESATTYTSDEDNTENKEEEEEEEDATPLTSAATKINPRVTGRKRRVVRSAISKILRKAAGAEQSIAEKDTTTTTSSSTSSSTPSTAAPASIALLLLGLGYIQPVHVLFVIFFSGYLTVLGLWSKSPVSGTMSEVGGGSSSSSSSMDGGGDNILVSMPSLPPQGHVPSLVSNPLGLMLTNSATYRMWLQTGAVVGFVLPLLAIGLYVLPFVVGVADLPSSFWGNILPRLEDNVAAAKTCAGPLFLLCCQAISESISKRCMAPLPLRILIPVAYNTIRLGLIWNWALSTTVSLGYAGRALAVANLVYWATNLFGFLLPTGVVRYMRAHFFCVEAEQVTLREGGEGAAGLMS
eukprot:CAMPEP_0185741288 /NCGR_PEP_ID=MMETSP1171-20130828/38879_1 /TAXON_ID=374046 /ORGANISM="Helicotheca tamensis, Strain CCMP826" /LENGTH=443 /DNA_ID=CAMNT_0028413249 /DNA_START=138 /DNA_END=1469 /DNA_ORIENTATION=+